MQPASCSFAIERGDTAAVTFRLSKGPINAPTPLDVSDSTLDLELAWPGGSILKSTADGSLSVAAGQVFTDVAWAAPPEETQRIPVGPQTEFRFVRTSPAGRRTYVTGLVTGLSRGLAGVGDPVVPLVITDASVVITLSVVDPGLSAAAVIAQILGGADADHNTLKKLADLIGHFRAANLDMSGIPTTQPGTAGVLWANGGVLQVS